MRRRRAQLVASAVEVVCPFCGESQANPVHGSFMWTEEDFGKQEPRVRCQSCDEPLLITTDPRAAFRSR